MSPSAQTDLVAEIAALRASTEERLDDLGERLDKLEADVREVRDLANMGRASLRTFLWIGGAIAGALGLVTALWDKIR